MLNLKLDQDIFRVTVWRLEKDCSALQILYFFKIFTYLRSKCRMDTIPQQKQGYNLSLGPPSS